jgi:RNA polymerase sigma-70 factor (ECF subfamily)
MVEPAGAGIPAIRPGDDSERLGAFFDHAIGEVFPYLFRRCGHDRSAAEDLTQETFVTAVEALRAGRLERITVGWLITCAQSRFIDHCRREARNDRHLHALPAAAPEQGPETLVITEGVVTELLGEMPASQRLVVVLHHLDGLPIADIAARTGRSTRAVESLLARGREFMRRRMKEDRDGG